MRRLAVLVSLVSLVGLVACGSEDGGSGGDALTKPEFIAQGDAVCAQLAADSRAITPPQDEAGFSAYFVELRAVTEAARADLAALNPPEDGVPVQTALVDAIDTFITTAEGAAEAAEAGDTVTAGDLAQQATEEAQAAAEVASGYGFQDCGGGGGA